MSHDPFGGYAAAEKKPEKDENSVPTGTAKEVLGWVGDDKDRAQKALDVEKADKSPRKTLVENLEKIVG